MRGFEIHQAQRFADFEVLFRREGERPGFADFADFDVAFFVRPERHVLARCIGYDGKRVANFRVELALVLFAFGDRLLEFGDLGHQPRCGCFVFRGLRLADFLRCRVPLRLRFLQLGQERAALFVEGDKARRLRLEPASAQTLIEGGRVVSDPFDVEHGSASSRAGCVEPSYTMLFARSRGAKNGDDAR